MGNIKSKYSSKEDFSIVFNEYYKELVVYIYQYTKDVNISEDIVQEMFCDLWERKIYEEIHTNPKGFLFKTARNSAINYLTRVKKITVEISDKLTNEMIYHEDMENIRKDKILYELIERLPEKRKEIFKMCVFDGMKYQEVANKLQISKNTVKTQMGRALSELKETAEKIILLFLLKK